MSSAEKGRLFTESMAFREDVFRICLGFSRNPSDAEDLAQDVYLKIFRMIGTLRHPGALREWIFRMARNVCLDDLRKKKMARLFKQRTAVRERFMENRNPGDSMEAAERLLKLKEAVRQLPRKQKEIFVLREYGHLSYEDLSGMLRIKKGTVMSRLNRAREAVKKFVLEDSDERIR